MIDITGPLNPGAVTLTGEPISLQKQLIGRLQQAILSGRLPAGSTLTSSRLLATELGVSRNTVVMAYDHLAAEGYVVADRQGTRVSDLFKSAQHAEASQSTEPMPVVLARRLAPLARTCSQPISPSALLSPGIPALEEFPITAWRRSLDRSISRTFPHSLGHREPLGEPSLRRAIATHLHVARGVRCDASQIVITEGARQALELCVTLMTNPGDSVWVEDPGYLGAKSAFHAGDLRTVPMPVTGEGLAVSAEAWNSTPPKLIYTSPAHQYPTGAVLSIARRLELISQARKSGAWIIEDDYDGDFRHAGEPIASMQGLVEDAPVLYVGSFSKTMFPALRIGFIVLPKRVMRDAHVVLHELLGGGHPLQQHALADFMNSGAFGRHLGRMRRLYRGRQQVLREALTQYFDREWILGGNAGMHLTLRLPAGVDDREVTEKARSQGIGAHALSAFFMKPTDQDCGLVIGYGNTRAEDIPHAVNVLAQITKVSTSLH
ncbi:MocR-like pyridoxine biosynthesis transcription factor PdxR [Vreelandella alkaliphila]|uniref:MocR-like pyridoxine biosynthesis transcription factor PdxR n=1 Tax=Vreelandella alkaliphila TaxID=272774 RepID=UPI003FD7903D